MTGLDIFAFLVMGVIIAAIAVAAVVLGGLPGKIAAGRNHPQAEAVKMCGWIGILTLGLLWPVAFIWAYTNPTRVALGDADSGYFDHAIPSRETLEETVGELTRRIESLEAELAVARQGEGGARS
jgi:Protein of unknown function (DUF3302)